MTMNRSLALPILNTSTALIAQNPILEYGQLAQETDTNRCKSGDGTSTYTQLTYAEWAYEIVEAAGTDTYTGTFSSPIFLAYFPMMRIRVRFTNANTGAATINLNSLGAKDIKKSVSTALAVGDIMAGGIYELYYDGTNFQIPAAVGGSAGALDIEQVLINGSDAGDEGIENLGNIVNTFGTRTLTIFQDSGNVQFWQPYLRDSSNGDVASVLIDISTANSPYAEIFATDGSKLTQIRASIDQVDIFGSPGTFRGAVYSADYSANYTARSLIDRGYAAATFAPISVTNALTATYVGFGSGANVLTGSADLVWTGSQLTVNGTVSSTGYQISGAAATGTILRGNGTSFVASTNTYPNTTGVGQILYATSANVIGSSANMTFDGNTLTIGTSVISPIIQGSTAASGSITIRSTSSGTDGDIIFQTDPTTTRLTIGSTGNIGIGLAPSTVFIDSRRDSNDSLTRFVMRNLSAGNAAQCLFQFVNDVAASTFLRQFGSGFTTSGMSVAGSGQLASNSTVGLIIGTDTTGNSPVSFWTNGVERAKITALGSKVMGVAALATNATDGFLYIPTCAGTPTGVPTAQTGTVAMIFDTTNNKLYIYDGGWLGGTTPGAFT